MKKAVKLTYAKWTDIDIFYHNFESAKFWVKELGEDIITLNQDEKDLKIEKFLNGTKKVISIKSRNNKYTLSARFVEVEDDVVLRTDCGPAEDREDRIRIDLHFENEKMLKKIDLSDYRNKYALENLILGKEEFVESLIQKATMLKKNLNSPWEKWGWRFENEQDPRYLKGLKELETELKILEDLINSQEKITEILKQGNELKIIYDLFVEKKYQESQEASDKFLKDYDIEITYKKTMQKW